MLAVFIFIIGFLNRSTSNKLHITIIISQIIIFCFIIVVYVLMKQYISSMFDHKKNGSLKVWI